MSNDLNSVTIIGRLGKDPEVRSTNNGKVANFSVAAGESWKDKNSGERKESVEWFNVVIWGDGLVGVAESYLKKGSRVYIQGKLKTRKWQDQSGADKYTTEVVLQGFDSKLIMLDGKPAEQREERGGQQADHSNSSETTRAYSRRELLDAGQRSQRTPIDDDIPF